MKIVFSLEAEKDLQEIFDFILGDNPTAAQSTLDAIKETIDSLRSHPHIGRPGRVSGTRELIIPNTPFIVPYQTSDDALEILRVYHSSRKWRKES